MLLGLGFQPGVHVGAAVAHTSAEPQRGRAGAFGPPSPDRADAHLEQLGQLGLG